MSRQPLELLDQPLFGSQQRLLTAHDFSRAARDRGVKVDTDELELLHRERLLVPFFRIRYDARLVRQRTPNATRHEVRAALDYVRTSGEGLKQERDVGDLFDPYNEPFVPRRTELRSYAGLPYSRSQYLYSPYQLLQLPSIREVLRLAGRAGRRRLYRLDFTGVWRRQFEHAERQNRGFLVPLHAVETVYRPAVVEQVRAPEVPGPSGDPFSAWDDLRTSFDPIALLEWIGWQPGDVVRVAEHLLLAGRSIDPLREWEDLVSHVRPERWRSLRGDALVAADHKIAAEMLLRFYDELVERKAAPPLEPLGRMREPRHSRLHRDRARLSEVLTGYDLLLQPAVLMVLEGATELLVMPRVLDLLNSKWRSYIDVVDAEGVTRALDPLIAYVAAPRIIREEGRSALMRPPVRVLVVMDPEGPYSTRQDREDRRRSG